MSLRALTPASEESIVRRAVAEASGAPSPPPRFYEPPQLADGSSYLFRSPADCGLADQEPERRFSWLSHAFRVLGCVNPPFSGSNRLGRRIFRAAPSPGDYPRDLIGSDCGQTADLRGICLPGRHAFGPC